MSVGKRMRRKKSTLTLFFFFGALTVLAIALLAYDTWRNKKLNKVFLFGALPLIASFPLRLMQWEPTHGCISPRG